MTGIGRRTEITDLTVCRAGFALWVFVYHVDLYVGISAHLGPLGVLIRHGYLGVDGFFVLSGLILGMVHPGLAYEPEGAVRFWGKRLARVYPVHLATIVVLAVLVVTGTVLGIAPREPERFSLGALAENLFLVQGWGFSNFLSWNYPSWSVSTEWAGYLAFPALWYFVGRWSAIIVAPIMIIAVSSLGVVEYFDGQTLNLTYGGALIRFFPEFIAGMAVARLVPAIADEFPTRAAAYIAIGVSVLAIWCGSDTVAVAGLLALMYALAMQADAERPPVFGNNAVLVLLGRLSYAFYMSFCTAELLVTQAFRHADMDPARQWLIFAGAMTVMTFGYAVILHVLVEVPVRRAADAWLAEPGVVTEEKKALLF
jgi:peptidoglycan/LPS O-acetylase OafA/YrhL